MPKLAINIVRYNQDFALLTRCIKSVLDQDFDDYSVVLTENGSLDSVKEKALELFGNHPAFRYVDNGANLGFAAAHNKFIRAANSPFVMPLNPDTVMSSAYITELIRAFDDPLVAAAEGKMLKPDRLPDGSWMIDGTGMIISRARRAGERGQLETDRCQYDHQTDIFGVSATAAIYRVSALETIKFADAEYFDEDFFTYWEDLDLSWRLRLAGYSSIYVPSALIYHSRFAGQSKNGIQTPLKFAQHIRSVPVLVVQWDWRNHLFAIIKNDFGWNFLRDSPRIISRELLLFIYLMVVQPRALKAVPQFLLLLPRILKKRTAIQRARVATTEEMKRWFENLPR